jgi:hypothetical protein
LADIVDCRFPQGKFPLGFEVPGPKERPVLVLSVEESSTDSDGCVVVVAYATSQNTTRVYPGEFVIPANPVTGLTKDTKFDLLNRHRLPFDSKWFGPAPGTNPGHPKRGRLDITQLETKKRLIAAISAAEKMRKIDND